MVKILHTADWHLGTFRSPVKDGINLRRQDTIKCLDELIRIASIEQPDYSLVSGDIFHVGRLMSDRCCDEIVTIAQYIRRLSETSKQVIVMRGTPNHDGEGQFNVLSGMFGEYQNVHIITVPTVLSFSDADIAVLPGFDRGVFRAIHPGLSKEEENEVFSSELSNIILGLKAKCSPNKKNILMTHYTVPGCDMESGQTTFLQQFEPVVQPDTLQAAGYDLVALGHIHRPQQIGKYPWYYSGAINAMNFNDEGQDRGFWMHYLGPHDGMDESVFHNTPIRDFLTLRFNDGDVSAINHGGIDDVATKYWRYNGAIKDKIVRIFYSSTAENAKAYRLNEAFIEKTLLADGAFMVWENLPDKIDEFANKTELKNTTDPKINLVQYLEEKEIPKDKIQELVEKACPIIAEAEAGMPTALNTGTFEPVEIQVRNYRNYEEETFNFSDISFCTINGQNGAGKSSLFMDAIIDCIYEEPREGEKTGWIRSDEKARSGSIMFTFRIGEKTFRVTRTRTKSGKGTLNLAERIEQEWVDCSKERYPDTQQEILNIIGMDSFTFKSCALIMQDQYGLFLQAKPEERVEVLGNLLGLGVYQAMEKISSEKAKSFGAKGRDTKQEIEIHLNTISGLGNPDKELDECSSELALYESRIRLKSAELDKNKLLLEHQQHAVERRKKLLESISKLQEKLALTEQNMEVHKAILEASSEVLAYKQEIKEKVSIYNILLEKEKELAGKAAVYSEKQKEAENLSNQIRTEQESYENLQSDISKKMDEIKSMQSVSENQEEVIRSKALEYEEQKTLLDAMYMKERYFRDIEKELIQERYKEEQIKTEYDSERNKLQMYEKELKKKAELLLNVDCIDIAHAKCGFLTDALFAKEQLEGFSDLFKKLEEEYIEKMKPVQEQVKALEKKLDRAKIDSDIITATEDNIKKLRPFVSMMEELNRRKSRISLINARLDVLRLNLLDTEKRLDTVKLRATEVDLECDKCRDAFETYEEIQKSLLNLKPWLEKEKQLPVAEERKRTAEERILEFTKDISMIKQEIEEKKAESERDEGSLKNMDDLTNIVHALESHIAEANEMVKEKQMKIGALQEKSDQVSKLRNEIADLQEKQAQYAKETATFDSLKTAFSRSGVPHQIIRSIIPQLATTSNTILGEMTGGKMGVEFRLERLQKNGKEKVSLDIFIEEYGKSALPYLSKSGGEKVKSSLAVILALAEMKSSAAGIQLGMLFIDEPPFLDSDGIQAYCDALETIQNRYQNIKIMAITHDPTMKARFPQNLDVVKTENGSKVIF